MKILTNSQIEDIKAVAIEEYKNNKEVINRKIEDRHYCDIVFDFNNPFINVLCIEREDQETNQEKTVITFFEKKHDEKRDLISWNLYCSNTQHNQLVAQFKKYMESKLEVKLSSKKK